MLTRKDIARLLTTGLKTEFQKGYNGVATFFQEITTEVKSTKASEEYGWLGEAAGLKEWIDERAPKALRENGFVIKNKDYEDSIAVDRNALEDEQYGQIKTRINSMAVAAKKSYDRLLVAVIENGHLEICYDGQNYFDTDHQEGKSGVQSNYFSSGKALTTANAKTVIQAMGQFRDDQNELVGANATHIMVPTDLEFAAKELFNAEIVGVSTDPVLAALKGRVKVIVNPYLANNGANSAWYIMDLSQAVKPFIYQNRRELTFAAQDNPEDDGYFFKKKLYYGVDARFAFGYADWRWCIKAKG